MSLLRRPREIGRGAGGRRREDAGSRGLAALEPSAAERFGESSGDQATEGANGAPVGSGGTPTSCRTWGVGLERATLPHAPAGATLWGGGLLRSGGSRVPFVRLALKGILSVAPHPLPHRIPATPFYSKRDGGDPNLPLQEGRSGA